MSIEEQVREFVEENFLIFDDSLNIRDDDSFFETGVIDSTGVQELVAFVEESFGIEVEDEEFVPANLDSIINLGQFIRRKRNGGS